jgi:hypothetical protein
MPQRGAAFGAEPRPIGIVHAARRTGSHGGHCTSGPWPSCSVRARRGGRGSAADRRGKDGVLPLVAGVLCSRRPGEVAMSPSDAHTTPRPERWRHTRIEVAAKVTSNHTQTAPR